MLSKFSVILLALSLAFSTVALCQEWYVANQITIGWDAVTEMEDGQAIPETDIVEYKVYLANTVTDPDKTNPAIIGVAAECTYIVTLNIEGQYFVGLQTLRMKADRTAIAESVIGWSDDPAIAANGTIFGVQ
jgi:hypothetical protein